MTAGVADQVFSVVGGGDVSAGARLQRGAGPAREAVVTQ